MNREEYREAHWQGRYFGWRGAIWQSWSIFFFGDEKAQGRWNLFPLLSTHYSAVKLWPGFWGKIFSAPFAAIAFAATALITVVTVLVADKGKLSADQCDVLSSALRRIRLHGRAISIAERGLLRCLPLGLCNPVTETLLHCGLMKSYLLCRKKFDMSASARHYSKAHLLAINDNLWGGIQSRRQRARVWKALGWYAAKMKWQETSVAYFENAAKNALETNTPDQIDKIQGMRS
mgnify:CR=1 FL=1